MEEEPFFGYHFERTQVGYERLLRLRLQSR